MLVSLRICTDVYDHAYNIVRFKYTEKWVSPPAKGFASCLMKLVTVSRCLRQVNRDTGTDMA